MSKHTPEIHLAATCTICGTTGYEANSPCPLHAAAPDLLAALERVRQRTIEGIEEADKHLFGTIGSLRHIQREVDAAIAAAKGEA